MLYLIVLLVGFTLGWLAHENRDYLPNIFNKDEDDK